MSKESTVRTASKEWDKEEEKLLRGLPFYHGFLAREDLEALLKNEGDYILRVTDVDNHKNGKPTGSSVKDLVLSVKAYATVDESKLATTTGMTEMDPASATPADKKLKRRNLVIRRSGGTYRVESSKKFTTVKGLIDFYMKNTGNVNKVVLRLKKAILQQSWEFAHTDITLTKLLGEGAYGEVRAGTLKQKNGQTIDVAVKLAKGTGEMSKEKIKEMMKEARLMRDLHHKNIVSLYGVAVLEQPLYILLELVNGGALSSYLRGHVGAVGLKEKLRMCLDAALGLEYLHKEGLLHRDMAARNCLYTDDKTVKISDFGLSRATLVYKMRAAMKLPVKWLAPETLQTFTFTDKSDTYSYGVIIFEVFENGVEPWEGLTNTETKKMVSEGKTLQLNAECPENLTNYVKTNLYAKDPAKRPVMSEVVRFLENFIAENKTDSVPKTPKTPEAPKKNYKASKEVA